MEEPKHDIIATGELYKQGHVNKSWNLRRFLLSGIYLQYFDPKSGNKKGEFDITECTLRKLTSEELGEPEARFAFILDGPGKKFIATASTEKNRSLWIKILEAQIRDFKDPIKRFTYGNEVVHGDGMVREKGVLGFSSSPWRLLVWTFTSRLDCLMFSAVILSRLRLLIIPE